jgi:membrane peptidoglycan carboxypeptidase
MRVERRPPALLRARARAASASEVLGAALPWIGFGSHAGDASDPRARRRAAWRGLCAGLSLLLAAALLFHELRTSALQAWVFSRLAARCQWVVGPGPGAPARPSRTGPFDERWGYTRLDEFERRLRARGFEIVEQARVSPALARLAAWGVTPPAAETAAAGLVVRDRQGIELFRGGRPDDQFPDLDAVPPIVIDMLLFVEDRGLLAPADPRRNPVVDPGRLLRAGLLYGGRLFGLDVPLVGGSTLATQVEKFRHSPGGRTTTPAEKLRQMVSASLRAYRDGPDTRQARRTILLDYLNSVPLAAAPGHGEVHGLGEGLRVWFGADRTRVAAALTRPGADPEKALACKQVLALILAARAPSRLLLTDRAALGARLDAYTTLLTRAGVLDAELARAMRAAPLAFARAPRPEPPSFAGAKGTSAVRMELLDLLGAGDLYTLDRLHVEATSTLDAGLQAGASTLLRRLRDPAFVAAAGLDQDRVLARGDIGRIDYSVLLYEATPSGNALRVHVDTVGQPFDLNRGMKLELGSTAKLRTLVHYLEIVAGLYAELAGRAPAALWARERGAADPLTRWAAATLASEPGLPLDRFLDRALDRSYSASPAEAFFTGGGRHRFANFDRSDDGRVLSVREGFVRSTNLVFIRLMRDIVRFHEARLPYDAGRVLRTRDDPARLALLRRVAAEESEQAMRGAYEAYRSRPPREIVSAVLGRRAASPRHLAMLFFAWHPGADSAALARWMREVAGRPVEAAEAERLTRAFGARRLTIADYGHLLGRHPLEVWTAGQLAAAPALSWGDLRARSADAERVASAWLFATRNVRAQDLRLRAAIERDAFDRIAAAWRRVGFPFERLVPSYATAIGSSADRPEALAELMGIVVNGGIRRPARSIASLALAPGTPYHTVLAPAASDGERVLPSEVAQAVRALLAEVVERGTGRRVRGAFVTADGTAVPAGGKTGSGDNRVERVARGGQVTASRPVSRTAAFVFYVGDRYYGVVTASVVGETAASYRFTSALPLAVLKRFAPALNERLAGPPTREAAAARAVSTASRPRVPASVQANPMTPADLSAGPGWQRGAVDRPPGRVATLPPGEATRRLRDSRFAQAPARA